MGQTQCCQANSYPSHQMAPPVPHSQLNLRFAVTFLFIQNVQPDPKENPDGNPNRLTERSLVSKRLGDSEEGDFTSKRPVLTHDVLDRLQELGTF